MKKLDTACDKSDHDDRNSVPSAPKVGSNPLVCTTETRHIETRSSFEGAAFLGGFWHWNLASLYMY